jgi:hypothetical protein
MAAPLSNPSDTFSDTEMQHLLDVASNLAGDYPEAMRAFAVALLEVLPIERLAGLSGEGQRDFRQEAVPDAGREGP